MTTSSISLSSRKIVIFGTFMIMMSCYLAFETFFYLQFICMGMNWQGKKSHPIIYVDHMYSKLVWYFSLVRQICFNRPCQDSFKAFLKFQVWNVYNSLRKLRTTRQSYHNVIPKTNQVKILRNFYKIIANILRNANLIDTSLSVPGTLCTHSFNQSHHFIFNKNDHLLNQVWMKQGLSNCVSYPACLMHAI